MNIARKIAENPDRKDWPEPLRSTPLEELSLDALIDWLAYCANKNLFWGSIREAIIQRYIDGEWIAVTERLPEDFGRYLVARSNDYPRFDVEYFAKGDGFYDDGEMDTNVTHWKELDYPSAPPRKAGEK